jgi:hypothetical protein
MTAVRLSAGLLPALLLLQLLARARVGAAQALEVCPISANQLQNVDYSQVKESCGTAVRPSRVARATHGSTGCDPLTFTPPRYYSARWL